jgi:thiaminase/transcriptional activator TenA
MAAVAEQMSSCAAMRAASDDIWQRIMAHPFLRDVEAETISDERLLHYFVQNVHYIDAAVKFSAEAAAKAPTRRSLELCVYMTQFATEEVARQRDYVAQLAEGLGREADWQIAPTAHAYTRHLLTLAAYGGTLDLLVGLSACQWTYDEFGTRLAPVVKHPITAAWLATFGSEHHNELSRNYNETVDELMEGATDTRRAELTETFRMGTRYEWMFWEMAYTLERWPV